MRGKTCFWFILTVGCHFSSFAGIKMNNVAVKLIIYTTFPLTPRIQTNKLHIFYGNNACVY